MQIVSLFVTRLIHSVTTHHSNDLLETCKVKAAKKIGSNIPDLLTDLRRAKCKISSILPPMRVARATGDGTGQGDIAGRFSYGLLIDFALRL